MKSYVILWKRTQIGQSTVEADNEEEAKSKATRGEDTDFEVLDNGGMNKAIWEIDYIEEEDEGTEYCLKQNKEEE